MKKQAALGEKFMQNRTKETEPANKVKAEVQNEVDPLDLAKMTKEDPEAEKAEIAKLANIYKDTLK